MAAWACGGNRAEVSWEGGLPFVIPGSNEDGSTLPWRLLFETIEKLIFRVLHILCAVPVDEEVSGLCGRGSA